MNIAPASSHKIVDLPIFSLFPRLFTLYNPRIKNIMRNNSNDAQTSSSSKGAADTDTDGGQNSSETESVKHAARIAAIKHRGVIGYSPMQSMECFFFQLFSTPDWTDNYDLTPELSSRPLKPRKKNDMQSSPLLKSIDSKKKAQLKILAILSNNERRLLQENVKDVFKVTVSVETHRYSQGQAFKEVIIVGKQSAGIRVHRFFKLLAEDRSSPLIELLMLSPESINNLCKPS